jgi:hypothetical protein
MWSQRMFRGRKLINNVCYNFSSGTICLYMLHPNASLNKIGIELAGTSGCKYTTGVRSRQGQGFFCAQCIHLRGWGVGGGGVLLRGQNCRSVKLTTHLNLVPRWRMRGTLPPFTVYFINGHPFIVMITTVSFLVDKFLLLHEIIISLYCVSSFTAVVETWTFVMWHSWEDAQKPFRKKSAKMWMSTWNERWK